jgi:hypothetical protein
MEVKQCQCYSKLMHYVMKMQNRSTIFLSITLAQGLTNFVINIHYRELVHLCGPEQKTRLYKIIVISELTKCTASFLTSSPPPHTHTHTHTHTKHVQWYFIFTGPGFMFFVNIYIFCFVLTK